MQNEIKNMTFVYYLYVIHRLSRIVFFSENTSVLTLISRKGWQWQLPMHPLHPVQNSEG